MLGTANSLGPSPTVSTLARAARSALVFGGAGFIGHHLLDELSRCGEYARLVCADLRCPKRRVPGVEYVNVDIRDDIPRDLCPGVSEIYNLAAVHRTPGHEDEEYYWTNVMGATNICHYAATNGVRLIAFTSSIAVYGACETSKDESSPLAPDSAYGRSKLVAERIHALWQAERADVRRLVVVRPAAIYGLGESGNFTRLSRLLRRGVAIYPGRRDTIKACGYVEDLAASILWARRRTESVFVYNFCHPERHSTADICAAFAKAAHYSAAELTVPLTAMVAGGFAFKALNAIGMRTSINRARVMKLNRSTNVVPARLQELNFPFRFTLEDGLARWKACSSGSDFD